MVEQAYDGEDNIKPTARLYDVDLAQIRHWKRHKKVGLTNFKMIHTGIWLVDGNKYKAIQDLIKRLRELIMLSLVE
jgi:transposase-like protein